MAKLALLLQIKSLMGHKDKLSVYAVTRAMKKYRDPGIWEALKQCYPNQKDRVRIIAEMTNMDQITPEGLAEAARLCNEIGVHPICPIICYAGSHKSALRIRKEALLAGFDYSLATGICRNYGLALATETFEHNLALVGELHLKTGAKRIPDHVTFKTLFLEHHGDEFHIDRSMNIAKLSTQGTLVYDSFDVFRTTRRSKSEISASKRVLKLHASEEAAFNAWSNEHRISRYFDKVIKVDAI